MLSKNDTLQLNHLIEERNDAKELIQKLNDDHKFTISQISHEIRNPVTLINSSLQLIEQEHPEVQKFAFWKETIQDMQYLRQLLNELSSYNNGEALHKERISVGEWLETITATAESFSGQPDVSFTYHADPVLPVIIGDPVKLRQAVSNLLRNAFEALNGFGHVSMMAAHKNDSLYITIQDTGCGIDSKYLDTLFEPFTTHKPGGTGLGLAITSRIIKAHRGKIHVDSTLGHGTVFTVTLPAA